ncbi:MAG: peptide chain release factor N(5)-glutamine methyltransferase [Bacilli bacterium]
MMTRQEAHRWASSLFFERGLEPTSAEWLLLRALRIERYQLLVDGHVPMTEQEEAMFTDWCQRHTQGEPVQYIAGEEMFYGRAFIVTPDTLVPRPETEELVALVLERTSARALDAASVVDVGTGTGAIAVSLAAENPSFDMHAIDIYAPTLEVAKRNGAVHDVNITFHLGNLLSGLTFVPNVVVSNPPYIPEFEWQELAVGVRDFEPKRALVAEEDGYVCYRLMLEQMAAWETDTLQLFAFEVGYNQAQTVANMARRHFPDWAIATRFDINGKERMVYGERLPK